MILKRTFNSSQLEHRQVAASESLLKTQIKVSSVWHLQLGLIVQWYKDRWREEEGEAGIIIGRNDRIKTKRSNVFEFPLWSFVTKINHVLIAWTFLPLLLLPVVLIDPVSPKCVGTRRWISNQLQDGPNPLFKEPPQEYESVKHLAWLMGCWAFCYQLKCYRAELQKGGKGRTVAATFTVGESGRSFSVASLADFRSRKEHYSREHLSAGHCWLLLTFLFRKSFHKGTEKWEKKGLIFWARNSGRQSGEIFQRAELLVFNEGSSASLPFNGIVWSTMKSRPH